MIRWSWIPILTPELGISVEDESCITLHTFNDITADNIKRLLQVADWAVKSDDVFQKEMIISDRLLHLKHLVQLRINNKEKDLLKLDLEIWPSTFPQKLFLGQKKQPLIRGQSEIHAGGLVKLEIGHYPSSDKYKHPEEQMHKVIRDVFHKHVHHSSDMLLPPVDALDKKEAIEKIALRYLEKFRLFAVLYG